MLLNWWQSFNRSRVKSFPLNVALELIDYRRFFKESVERLKICVFECWRTLETHVVSVRMFRLVLDCTLLLLSSLCFSFSDALWLFHDQMKWKSWIRDRKKLEVKQQMHLKLVCVFVIASMFLLRFFLLPKTKEIYYLNTLFSKHIVHLELLKRSLWGVHGSISQMCHFNPKSQNKICI